MSFGGDKRDRTADLLNAIQALSQLSYTPKFNCAVRQLLYYSINWRNVNSFFLFLFSAGYPGLLDRGILGYFNQQSFAPAGMASSSMMRFSLSSPFSVWTADRSIPQDSRPIIFLGGRFTMATNVLPMRSSGL